MYLRFEEPASLKNVFVKGIPSTSHAFLPACWGGGPQIGEVTYGGSPHLSCKRDQVQMRDMDRHVNSPKQVTSPTWGPPPSWKQALRKGLEINLVLPINTNNFSLSTETNFVPLRHLSVPVCACATWQFSCSIRITETWVFGGDCWLGRHWGHR